MKKFLAMILSLAMVFALVACGGEKTDDSQNLSLIHISEPTRL